MSETGKSSKSFSSPYSLLHVFIDNVIIGNALSVFDRIGAKIWSLASVNCTLKEYAGIWRKCLRLSQVKSTSLNPNNMVEENLECAYGGESSAGCPALHQTCTRSPCQKTEHSSRLLQDSRFAIGPSLVLTKLSAAPHCQIRCGQDMLKKLGSGERPTNGKTQ